jgi:hypothetical protein
MGLVRARRRNQGSDLDALLDAAVAGLAALTLAWAFVISRLLHDKVVPGQVKFLLICYPALSVFLVAIVASLAFSANQRPVIAFRLVLLGMASMLVGDVIYMFVDSGLWDVRQQFVDLPYGLAYLLFTVAVLHPSMRLVSDPPRVEDSPPRDSDLLAAGAVHPALVSLPRAGATPATTSCSAGSSWHDSHRALPRWRALAARAFRGPAHPPGAARHPHRSAEPHTFVEAPGQALADERPQDRASPCCSSTSTSSRPSTAARAQHGRRAARIRLQAAAGQPP